MMSDFLYQATYVITPETIATSFAAGFLIGFIYLSQVAYLRSLLLVLLFVGEAFLIAAVFARWVDNVPEWPRTIAWATLWIPFLLMAGAGAELRHRLHAR